MLTFNINERSKLKCVDNGVKFAIFDIDAKLIRYVMNDAAFTESSDTINTIIEYDDLVESWDQNFYIFKNSLTG